MPQWRFIFRQARRRSCLQASEVQDSLGFSSISPITKLKEVMTSGMNFPILSSQFFEKHTPDLGFFTKWRGLYAWNDQIMPIYEWQNILYVGCVHPPQDFKAPQKVVFLLCEPEALKSVWYNFEGTVVLSSASAKPQIPQQQISTTPTLTLDFGNINSTNEAIIAFDPIPESLAETDPAIHDSDLSLDEKIDLNSFAPPATEHSEELLAIDPIAPEDQNNPALEIPLVSSDEADLKFEGPAEPELLTFEKPAESEKPPALQASSAPQQTPMDPMEALMMQATPTSPMANSESLLQDVESDENTPKEETPEEEGLELLDLGNNPPVPNLNSPAISAPGTSDSLDEKTIKIDSLAISESPLAGLKASDLEQSLAPAATTGAEAAPAAAASANTPAESKKPKTESSGLKSPPHETWIEKAFSEIKLEYQKVMILMRTGDQIKPWRWDEDFKSSTATLTPFSLIPPSPFRIVHRTHKAYHGYVVANELNDKFFQQWNDSDTPEHLTIVPIMNQDHVIGMLVAIGSKSADTKGCLQLMEDKAQTLASHIQVANAA